MNLKVKINGKNYEAEEGEYILDVCRRNRIMVPTLCRHESLFGLGACRLCVVELNEGGKSQIVVSCSYPLSCDCEVSTESELVKTVRKTVLSMLITRAPMGDRLATLCQFYGVEDQAAMEARFAEKKTGKAAKHLDEACVLCGLCVRACTSLGTGAISTVGRGVAKKISTPYDEPSADCVGCGSCAQVCPTKAIECTEGKGKRTIWGKEFKLIPCASCGSLFATEEEFALAVTKAAKGTPEPSGEVLCDVCRKKKSADVLAAAFGER